MHSSTLQIGLAAALLLFTACSPRAISQSTPPRQLDMTQETVSWDDGIEVTFDRGLFNLPANRRTRSAATIPVEVVRFTRDANAPRGIPPVVYLQGGPGYGSIYEFLDDSRFYTRTLQPLLGLTDVILVGQRGFGPSAMPCDDREPLSLSESFDDTLREQAWQRGLERCRQTWEAAGRDLDGINVVEAAADVADAVRALGYSQVQLYGMSFGSHHGIAILQNHPELVARATLGALEGPDHTVDSPDGLLNGLTAIAAAAEASPALRALIPPEGLLEAYQNLIHRADASPIIVETRHPDTDEPITLRLDGDDFRELSGGVTRGLKFRFIMPAWPLDLLAILNGDYESAARRIFRLNTSTGLDAAAGYAYDCASGISRERRALYGQSTAIDMVGNTWHEHETDCAAWGVDLGEGFRAGTDIDVPTVLLHGTWDMNTPFTNAQDLRPVFQNHHFVAIEGGSHGAVREASQAIDGFSDALLRWYATGDWSQLPERVELPPLEWEAPE
ncbi:MAG: alpha/beta fold hydrolase [Bacteroidota bacterium]